MTMAFVVDLRIVSGLVADGLTVDKRTGAARLSPELAARAEEVRQEVWAPISARRVAT
jgi:hypothetical protein